MIYLSTVEVFAVSKWIILIVVDIDSLIIFVFDSANLFSYDSLLWCSAHQCVNHQLSALYQIYELFATVLCAESDLYLFLSSSVHLTHWITLIMFNILVCKSIKFYPGLFSCIYILSFSLLLFIPLNPLSCESTNSIISKDVLILRFLSFCWYCVLNFELIDFVTNSLRSQRKGRG